MMSPCVMCRVPGSGEEWFSRQTTCIPGRISCSSCEGSDATAAAAAAVAAAAADPDWEEEVPTPELSDRTSAELTASNVLVGMGEKHKFYSTQFFGLPCASQP